MADAAPDFIPLPSPKKAEAPDFIPLTPKGDRKALDNAVIDSDLSALLKGAGTSAIKGLSLIGGMPGDLQGLTDYLVARVRSPLSPSTAAVNADRTKDFREKAYERFREENPTLSRIAAAVPGAPTSADVAKPVLDVTGEYVPQSDLGRYAMIGAEGAVGMLGPGGLAGGLKAAGRGTEGVVNLAREALKGGVKAAPLGGAANTAGTLAAEFTGDPLVGMAAGAVVPLGLQAGTKAAGNYAAPMIPGQRQGLADQKLFETAKNPAAALAAARAAEIVPGSKPTLAEVTGDSGLLKGQKAAQTVDQAPFNTQQSEQNAARLAELQKMAPADADIMAPAKLFRDRLQNIEQAALETVNMVKKRAEEANAAIPVGTPPEISGAQLRDTIAAAAEKARAERSRLYKAVDPDGTLSVITAGARDAATDLAAKIDPAVQIPSPIATPIIEMVANLPEVTPFAKLMDMDSTITAEMAKAKVAQDNIGHGQLVQLKGAVMDAINNAVENQAKWEQGAVARGEIRADDTVGARLLQDSQEWMAQKSGRAISARAGNDGSTGPSGVSGVYRGQGEAGRGSGVSPGPEGIPGDVPNFDAEAAQRLAAAKQAHSEYAQTYREGPVGQVLKDNGFAEQYRMPSAGVPAAAFASGDKGYASTQAFLNAAKGAPEAVSALQDIAVARLRQEMKGGDLTPQALKSWQAKYANSLRAIDEVSPGFSQKFNDAATLTDTLGISQRALENALANEQKGIAGRFLGASDPSEVVKQVGQMLSAKDGPSQLKDLLAAAGTNTGALQGLRKAGVEYMTDRLTNAGVTEQGQPVLSSAKLRDFLSSNEGSLKTLYGEEHLANMRRVADDMERSQKAFDAMRVKGGSDTMSNAIEWLKDKGPEASNKLISAAMLWEMGQSLVQGDMMSAFGAAAGATTKHFFDRMRAAGINDARDLYVRGLVDPEVGAAMLERAIDKNGKVNASALKKLGDAVGTSAARSAYMMAPEEKRERRASGGAVMDHASIASKLIRRAEMAGKTQASTTEPLLAVPDDTVARALEIAGQGF